MVEWSNLRFIGNAPEAAKEARRQVYERTLYGEDIVTQLSGEKKELYQANEIEKTAEQEALFRFAEEYLNEKRKACGIPATPFPMKNIFIVERDFFSSKYGAHARAMAHPAAQTIGIAQHASDFVLASAAFHELLHCKSALTLQIFVDKSTGNIHEKIVRTGSSIFAPESPQHVASHAHFDGLNEAITVFEQMRFNRALLALPAMEENKKLLESDEGKREIDAIVHDTGEDPEDIFWFDKIKRERVALPYPKQRAVLRYVCESIAADQQCPVDEVHDLFLVSCFTGRALELARSVEAAFGAGAFRRLADMDTDETSGVQTYEALRKMRLRKEKKNREID